MAWIADCYYRICRTVWSDDLKKMGTKCHTCHCVSQRKRSLQKDPQIHDGDLGGQMDSKHWLLVSLLYQQWNIYVCNIIKSLICLSFLVGIKECTKNTKYVSEEPYEISMDVHGIRQGPYLGRQRALNKVSFVSLCEYFILRTFTWMVVLFHSPICRKQNFLTD